MGISCVWLMGFSPGHFGFPIHSFWMLELDVRLPISKVGLGRVVLFTLTTTFCLTHILISLCTSFLLFFFLFFLFLFLFFFFSSFFLSFFVSVFIYLFIYFLLFVFFFSRHIYAIFFHVIFILSTSLPSWSRHFHARPCEEGGDFKQLSAQVISR